jgi:hypothetical protein
MVHGHAFCKITLQTPSRGFPISATLTFVLSDIEGSFTTLILLLLYLQNFWRMYFIFCLDEHATSPVCRRSWLCWDMLYQSSPRNGGGKYVTEIIFFLHLPPSSIIYADILNVLSNFYFYFYQILTAFNMFKIMSEVAHYKLVAHDSFKLTFI